MRALISCLLAGVLLCANGSPARAAPAAAAESFPTVLTASGEVSCEEFSEEQRANNAALHTALMDLFVAWVWRFLSDYDQRGFSDEGFAQADGPMDLPDQATVLAFLEHFCDHNPSSNVYYGALALLRSRHRSGLGSTQAVIVGRVRVRKTKAPTRGRRA